MAVQAEPGDAALIDALRSGDKRAFARLVDSHHSSLLRVARLHVRDRAVAEEVVHDTWLTVPEGIDRFEARSSLNTWIYRILANRAKTRAGETTRADPCANQLAATPPAITTWTLARTPGSQHVDKHQKRPPVSRATNAPYLAVCDVE